MKTKKERKTDPPLFLDMPFGDALKRFAHTKPDEVEPPKGRKKKAPKQKLTSDSIRADHTTQRDSSFADNGD